MSEVKSLWGSIPIPVLTTEVDADYVNLMLEQVNLLKSQTQGLLLGDVSRTWCYGELSSLSFNITAPMLRNYRYSLFIAMVGLYKYPVFMYERGQFDGETWSIAGTPYMKSPKHIETKTLEISPNEFRYLLSPTYFIENFEQFEAALAKILQSDSTKDVIKTLLEKSQLVFT
ncbi:MAG: hypothetical protein FWD31_08665 [Planctomycetaceae bacterium]|nr:hypothetical protein [Planctomycetaceae bacterium]